MNTVSYLKEIYGYSVPIFLKDIRIGGKSKTSIRKDLSRAVENGSIIRKGQGIYCFKLEGEYSDTVSFENIIEHKYIKDDHGIPGLDLDIYGYHTGLTFLNNLGISTQVPAVLEVVTNNTSCTRTITIKNRKAIIHKGRIKIDRLNYKSLQFFDAFSLLHKEEILENKETLSSYISKHLSKESFEKYIGLYPNRVMKIIVESGLIHAFR